jgi:hypothetical protein
MARCFEAIDSAVAALAVFCLLMAWAFVFRLAFLRLFGLAFFPLFLAFLAVDFPDERFNFFAERFFLVAMTETPNMFSTGCCQKL